MTQDNNQTTTTNEEAHIQQNREAQKEARAKRVEESRALLAKLSEAYPTIFPHPKDGRPVVLAIGLHRELVPIVQEWGFSAATLRSALAWYTKQLRYQNAIFHATHRTNLDGSDAEAIEEEHKAVAKANIERIEAWLKENRPEAVRENAPKNRKSNRPKQRRAEGNRPASASKRAPKSSDSKKADNRPEQTLDEKMQSLLNKFNQ